MNRLAKEKSPYLKQHQANPVDWYPWGKEAFDKAAAEDKPVFLSIGYSTCHWCHVMEQESFENEEIARLLNDSFVSIKVDREERPDLDQIYMQAVQALTRSGGWPLSVFLTPQGKPFTGGTYFPPEDRWGRPGMKTILPRLAELWNEKRNDLLDASEQVTRLLQESPQTSPSGQPHEDLLKKVFEQLQATFDPVYGGFGEQPKFPRCHDLTFLLRYWYRYRSQRALDMASLSLKKMAWGGIYDHLGGGFSRYSTDNQWRVPHFEKMLYDQAMTARAYLEMHHVTRDVFYAEVARGIFDYVLRDLRDPKGAFYSAEDADSEGEEGKFYVWRPEAIRGFLGEEKGNLICEYYGVKEEGNFEHHTTVLSVSAAEAEFAKAKGLDPNEWNRILTSARETLLAQRSKRIRPHLDDKILTAWNGMMISSLAYGSRVLKDETLLKAATESARFILKELSREGRLLRRYCGEEAAIPAFQDDYAYFAQGLLDLFEATQDLAWLEESARLTQEMIRLFWDEKSGGLFYTSADGENLIARLKEYYDGAVPSGNSVAAGLLLKLGCILENEELQQKAQRIFLSNMEQLSRFPSGFSQLISAFDFALGPTTEVVLAGDPQSSKARQTVDLIDRTFRPRLTFGKNRPAETGQDFAVYVCRNKVCREPVTDPQKVGAFLDE